MPALDGAVTRMCLCLQGSADAAHSLVAKAVADPATVTASRELAEKVLSVSAAQSLSSLLSGRRLLGDQVRAPAAAAVSPSPVCRLTMRSPTHACSRMRYVCVPPAVVPDPDTMQMLLRAGKGSR